MIIVQSSMNNQICIKNKSNFQYWHLKIIRTKIDIFMIITYYQNTILNQRYSLLKIRVIKFLLQKVRFSIKLLSFL